MQASKPTHSARLHVGRIMFLREFNIVDSATSVDQLRRRLKIEELGQYGEPFIPEFVYDAIRTLPRFASMRVRVFYIRFR